MTISPNSVVSVNYHLTVAGDNGEDGQLDSETIAVGKNVPMVDNEGHRLWGKVLEISLENIRMDFNHPLAGKVLHFNGEVLDTRAATTEELEHGHVHGPG